MSARSLFRLSGLAAIVAGTLEALNTVLDFVLFPPEQSLIHTSVMSLSQKAATNAWAIQQSVNWGAKVVLLLALVGLYSHQANRAGALGFIAFLLAFVGITLVFGSIFGYFLLAPDLARVAPAFLDGGPTQLSLAGRLAFTLPFVMAQMGILLFGVASWQSKVFPRWAAALFIFTPFLFVAGGLINLPFLGDVAFGAGLVGMGCALWADLQEPEEQRAVAAVS